MARVKSKLEELEVRPHKSRGQNFLIRPEIVQSILNFASIGSDSTVVEIGPGLGALTEELYSKVGSNLTLIEIEEKFCEELKRKFSDTRIINQDVREVSFSEIGKNLTVFGNLPYSFSTEIVFHLLGFHASIDRAVLMLQREFAQRLGAGPGGKEYGTISVMCQMFCDVKLGPVVDGRSFHPPTKVESRVIELKFLPTSRFPLSSSELLRKVVKASFAQRRKKILNSIKSTSFFPIDVLLKAIERSGVDPSQRAETVTLKQFADLTNALAV